jgi:DNA-binding CsgD family transcriptional regulator
MHTDERQTGDVVREPMPAASGLLLQGLDRQQRREGTAPLSPAPTATTSASVVVACIPVPAFVCDGDRIIVANDPAARLLGSVGRHRAGRSFSGLFALSYRARIKCVLHVEPGSCTRLHAATLLTAAGGARRVELRLAGVELGGQRLTLVTATAAGMPLLEPVPASASRPVGPRRVQRLTPREHQILALVTQGATSRAIAQQLGISRRTVEAHRANFLRKLDLRGQGSQSHGAAR